MRCLAIALAIAAAAVSGAGAGAGAEDNVVARGVYLVSLMDCAGCHMPRGADGVPLVEAGLSGGNIGFEIPGMGVFWAPNLTPSDSGLGSWTDLEIATAITGGLRPDGRSLAPAMPWPAYANLSAADTNAIVAYLRSLQATDTPRLDPVSDPAQAVAPFFRVVAP